MIKGRHIICALSAALLALASVAQAETLPALPQPEPPAALVLPAAPADAAVLPVEAPAVEVTATTIPAPLPPERPAVVVKRVARAPVVHRVRHVAAARAPRRVDVATVAAPNRFVAPAERHACASANCNLYVMLGVGY